MTPETRETLTIHADCVEDELDGQAKHGITEARVLVDRTVLVALRDVLTPRVCGTCKSRNLTTGACYQDVQDPKGEEVTDTLSPWNWRNRDEFGCLGWQAREGEGGER